MVTNTTRTSSTTCFWPSSSSSSSLKIHFRLHVLLRWHIRSLSTCPVRVYSWKSFSLEFLEHFLLDYSGFLSFFILLLFVQAVPNSLSESCVVSGFWLIVIIHVWWCYDDFNSGMCDRLDLTTFKSFTVVYFSSYNSVVWCSSVLLLRPRELLQSIVMSMSACISVREDIFGTTHAIFTNFLCVLPMFVARYSSSMLTIGRIAYRREGGNESAHAGKV